MPSISVGANACKPMSRRVGKTNDTARAEVGERSRSCHSGPTLASFGYAKAPKRIALNPVRIILSGMQDKNDERPPGWEVFLFKIQNVCGFGRRHTGAVK